MVSDADPMLESDHLEQLLETPAPPQPVVVVQYRNRGVPTWVFFLSVMLVPPIALYVYHRTVVEKDRVRAAEERSLLALQIKKERALLPLVRDTPSSNAVLPEPRVAAAGAGTDDVPGSLKSATEATPSVPQPGAKAPADPNPSKLLASAGQPLPQSAAQSKESASPISAAGVARPGAVAEKGAPVGAAENPNPFTQEKTAPITRRSDVPDPFADIDKPPRPPIPNDGTGLAAEAGEAGDTISAETKSPSGESANVANRGRLFVISPEKPQDGAAAPASGAAADGPFASGTAPGAQAASRAGRIGAQPLAPLPTKEDNEREIEEAAAKLKAQMDVGNRDSEIRAERFEEQRKFRDELRELLKAKGPQVGPEIAKLKQRYDYDLDPLKWEQARDAWRFSRTTMTFRDKVKHIRSLEVPETAILELIWYSTLPTIGKRQGPRDANEVWVRAAEQLLRCELPRVPPAGPRSPGGSDAAAAPTRKAIVSTPR